MYKVLCDGETIYDAKLADYKIFDAQLDLELNKTGTFVFTIYPKHPNFNKLFKMVSDIEVYQGGDVIFRGRILNEEQGFYQQKKITCEGELAFLIDSYIEPFGSENAPWKGTVEEFLTHFLDLHNKRVGEGRKAFYLGDISDELKGLEVSLHETEYKTALDIITAGTVGKHNGYLWLSRKDGKNYINYFLEEDIPSPSNQTIKFRKNLLDLTKSVKGQDLMTAIIPLGESSGDKELTIKGYKDDNDYILDKEAEKRFGRIFKTVVFEGVKTQEELYNKAVEHLKEATKLAVSVELTAADLAGIEGVDAFRLGQRLEVDTIHDLEAGDVEKYLVKKLSINILQPASNQITVGATFTTLTQSTNASNASQSATAATVKEIQKKSSGTVTQNDLQNTERRMTRAITQVSNRVDTLEGRVKKTEDDMPKKTSDLTNDSGYMTETQVRALIESYLGGGDDSGGDDTGGDDSGGGNTGGGTEEPLDFFTLTETDDGYLVSGNAESEEYNNATSFHIPWEYNGAPVTGVAESGFERNNNITSVVIGEGVKTIGDYAFSNCNSLDTVALPSTIERIGRYAFAPCNSLTEVIYYGTVAMLEELISSGAIASNWLRGAESLTFVACADGNYEL